MDGPFLSLIELLHRASQASSSAYHQQQAGQHAITLTQLFVLSAIERNEGTSQTALVAASGVDRSTISGILDRLQKSGLVTRRRDKTDARVYIVKMSEEGKIRLSEAQAILKKAENTLIAALPQRNAAELERQLQIIIDTAVKHQDNAES